MANPLTRGGVIVGGEDSQVDQSKMLNGAQTQSLLSVIEKWKEGSLTEQQAVKIISVSVGISEDDAGSILRGK